MGSAAPATADRARAEDSFYEKLTSLKQQRKVDEAK